MRRPGRARLAVAALIGVVVFLLGSLVQEVRERDRKIDRLATSQESVVATLTDVLTRVIATETAARAAGQAPTVTVETILEQIRGLDRSIVDEALRRAQRGAPGPAGPSGQRGVPGPAGPAGTAPPASSSTTAPTGPATTTTTRPTPPTTSSTSTTTTSTTTTTTRPCPIGALGICLVR